MTGSTAIRIGGLVVDPPVVLAPMAGVTDRAFRRICRRFGGGLFVSEMLTSRAVVEGNERTMRMASFADDEPVRSVQLYGIDPTVVALAVHRLVDEIGAQHIDLNFGCPVPKITRHGGGAALPVHRDLFGAIVRGAVGAAGGVPVTVKMRIGVDDRHRTLLDAGRIAEEAGVAAVALHARTAAQLYSGEADWSAIGELRQAVRSIPVLGNGDIWEGDDARRMMAETGCDGVVVGRGCLGRPWLFRDLDAATKRLPPFDPPALGGVLDIMGDHARYLVEDLGEPAAMRAFRKHAAWYLLGYPIEPLIRRDATRVASLADLDRLTDALTPFADLRASAPSGPRGPTRGPQRVALPHGWLDAAADGAPAPEAEQAVSGG
jgi:nifR3 family TIM-barrel protein